jgi:hypothetical protein
MSKKKTAAPNLKARIIKKAVTPGRFPKNGQSYINTTLIMEVVYDRARKGQILRMNVSSQTPTGHLATLPVGTILKGLRPLALRSPRYKSKATGIVCSPYSKVEVFKNA